MNVLLFFCILIMSSSSFSTPLELKACPNTPNCVSSTANDEHAIKPFTLTSGSTLNIQQLIQLINNSDSNVSVTHDAQHIHAEFTSRVFGFVDDLDLMINPTQNIINVRSASRTGHYDFGVNRRRVEKLRGLFKDAGIIQ
ncbi:MAG: DUF1499 domain-containing protein [Cycloclasticus sp.]